MDFDLLMKTWNVFFILSSEGWNDVITIDFFFFKGLLIVLFQLIDSSIESGIWRFLMFYHCLYALYLAQICLTDLFLFFDLLFILFFEIIVVSL
jgi:hypothetical protein